MRIISSLFVLAILLSSCTITRIEKRRYNSGWHVTKLKQSHYNKQVASQQAKEDTAFATNPESMVVAATDTISQAPVIDNLSNTTQSSDLVNYSVVVPEVARPVKNYPKELANAGKKQSAESKNTCIKPNEPKDESGLKVRKQVATVVFIVAAVFTLLGIFGLIFPFIAIALGGYTLLLLALGFFLSIMSIFQTTHVLREIKKSGENQGRVAFGVMRALSWILFISSFLFLVLIVGIVLFLFALIG